MWIVRVWITIGVTWINGIRNGIGNGIQHGNGCGCVWIRMLGIGSRVG
jgi:hypothetical protein